MKRFLYFVALCLFGTTVLLTSCDKENAVIVEEDINGFKKSPEREGFGIQMPELTEEQRAVYEKYKDAGMTVLIGDENSRSSHENVYFEWAPGYKTLQLETTSGWITVYSGYADNVGFSLPYHPYARECGRSVKYINWRFGSLAIYGSCMGLSMEYKVSGTTVDTDLYNHPEAGPGVDTWHYVKTRNGDIGSTTSNELAMLAYGCDSGENYTWCQ